MADLESNPDPKEVELVTSADAVTDGTAPDADTQSSAASEAGDRTAEDGSRAPNDPAEGA
ncbi:hypothetical protein [Spirosoma pollinicola]|uniref:Uncharacterized protein n=1 Tax=Spirosoma pollinicola TaxID=2057025 RepID=A0A2K8YSR2_9BACT|nr:hypothetical protein [Spirosoma pollinicola]AUD00663.1 hypothetical protein CWM47_01815 [Spirosoma pollinicola]